MGPYSFGAEYLRDLLRLSEPIQYEELLEDAQRFLKPHELAEFDILAKRDLFSITPIWPDQLGVAHDYGPESPPSTS